MAIIKIFESLVLVGQQNGVVVIPEATPLTRLNYFDGKFLRASDLKAEQDYLRQLVRQSNQAGDAGVAFGYDVTLGVGDTLEIGAGLAIDPQGRVLLLPRETTINIQELIEKSRALQSLLQANKVQREGGFELCELSSETPPVNPLAASNLFVITLSHAEALCGEEDVFGKLCEEACVTSTDRPFVVEGLVVRAIPLALQTPLSNSKAVPMAQIHLRSRVASAYFEDERRRVASLISKAGLEQATWCLGADAEGGSGVPIGVVAREGATTIFLDPWIARRERIDAPAKRYWQWRMMMRPWDVFLAQILQFQCQLHDLFKKIPGSGGDDDPCGGAGNAIKEAAETIAELTKFYEAATNRFVTLRADFAEELTIKGGLSRLNLVNTKLITVSQALDVAPQDRLLIRGGIVELPSAGYLPVVPGAGLTINQQVRRMMGEGVDLRFCVVRHDYVAHALEEAQHMERISLLQGLDDPANKPQVDILVPDGQILEQQQLSPGRGFEAAVDVHPGLLSADSNSSFTNVAARIIPRGIKFTGAARSEKLPSGGGAAYISAEYVVSRASIASSNRATTTPQPGATINVNPGRLASLFERAPLATAVGGNPRAGLWISLQCERNIFTLGRGDTSNVNARAIVGAEIPGSGQTTRLAQDVELNGVFEITQAATLTGSARVVKGRFRNAQFAFIFEEPPRETSLVDLGATITLTGASAIEIALTSPEVQIELSANWDKQPLEVKADIILLQNDDGEQQEIVLTEAALKENAGVLSDKDPSHILALDALEVVAATLGDINFADAKARLLFPPPPKPTDGLIVRGTRDWVLFHRRRTKVCSEEKLAAPPPPARRYLIWETGVADLADANQLRDLLIQSGSIPANRLNPVRFPVEFGGGVTTLLTTPEDVLTAWRSASSGDQLVYGAISTQGAVSEDGEILALNRLNRLITTLAPVTPRHPQALDPDALPRINLQTDGADGVILLFTMNQAVATLCNDVYAILNSDLARRIDDQLNQGSLPPNLAQAGLMPLGKVLFDATTGAPNQASLDAVANAWRDAGGGAPSGSRVVYKRGDTQEGVYQTQARAIVQAFGGTVPPFPAFGVVDALPSTCPSITLAVSTTRRVRTARIVPYLMRVVGGPRDILQAPVMSVEFGVNGRISRFLSANDLNNLAQLGGIIRGELLFGEALTVVGDPDVRVLSLSESFNAAGIPLNDWPFGEVSQVDRQFLMEGNARFDDLVFLQIVQIN
jgi:hypothetical protein